MKGKVEVEIVILYFSIFGLELVKNHQGIPSIRGLNRSCFIYVSNKKKSSGGLSDAEMRFACLTFNRAWSLPRHPPPNPPPLPAQPPLMFDFHL